jgi:hypothetical protein
VLVLSYVAQANENGLVLFSSYGALRVDKNVKTVLAPDTRDHYVDRYFVREKVEGHEEDITLTQ